MIIIPSKQLLLVTAEQSKQLFLFDPKTSSVITKYHIEPTMSKCIVSYPQVNQFVTAFTNKTFLNVWSTDNQEPVNKVSTAELITSMELSRDKNLLYAGSQSGTLFIWEMPSGVLISKTTIHSNQVNKIYEYERGYLMTVSKNELKVWPMSAFLIETERPSPLKTFNSVLEIIDVEFLRNVFIVLTSKSVTQYLCGNENCKFPQIHKYEVEYATTICTSMSHYYVGNVKGCIEGREIKSSNDELEISDLDFEFVSEKEQIEVKRNSGKILLETQTNKHPITCLVHLKTLPYLISGNSEGEITVWQNHSLKKTLKLFKSSIKLIQNIPRPFEEKVAQSLKIRPFAKYEQNKETEPLEINLSLLEPRANKISNNLHEVTYQIEEEAQNELILERILSSLKNPIDQIRSRVNQLQEQKQQLIKANLKYCEIWNHTEEDIN